MNIPLSSSNCRYPLSQPQRFYADLTFDRIQKAYEDLASTLADNEDIAVIVPLLNGQQIAMETMGFQNPCFIVVGGIDSSGDKMRVLISHNNVQVIFKIIKRQPDQKKNKIGFLGETDASSITQDQSEQE